MSELILPLEQLVEKLQLLPGVGRKSAMKYAFRILELDDEQVREFAQALVNAKENIHSCKRCFNICEGDFCSICKDDNRDKSTVCVVEDARAIMAFEKVKEYKGLYHVLQGTISPMDGVGPDKLRIAELVERVKNENIKEVIIATNPTIEGETTAMYITKLMRTNNVRVTRLAYGIPVGGDLEYADEVTLFKAIEGRREI